MAYSWLKRNDHDLGCYVPIDVYSLAILGSSHARWWFAGLSAAAIGVGEDDRFDAELDGHDWQGRRMVGPGSQAFCTV